MDGWGGLHGRERTVERRMIEREVRTDLSAQSRLIIVGGQEVPWPMGALNCTRPLFPIPVRRESTGLYEDSE